MTFGPGLESSWSLGAGERDTERISASESRLLSSLRGDSERPRDIFRLLGVKFEIRTAALSSHLLETQMAEAIQQLILTTLDQDGDIKDTRQLVLPGESTPAASQDAQLLIIAALNSLNSRNVCESSHIMNILYTDLLHRWSTIRPKRSIPMSSLQKGIRSLNKDRTKLVFGQPYPTRTLVQSYSSTISGAK